MEEQLLKQIGAIVDILSKGFDCVIKKDKFGNVKIMYCKPKKWKEEQPKGDIE